MCERNTIDSTQCSVDPTLITRFALPVNEQMRDARAERDERQR